MGRRGAGESHIADRRDPAIVKRELIRIACRLGAIAVEVLWVGLIIWGFIKWKYFMH